LIILIIFKYFIILILT